jgi:hypothetical protein
MKFLLASILVASLATPAFAQAPAKAAANAKKPVSVKKVPPATKRQAIEEATPLEEPDPAIKLSEADLDVARRVHVGEIQCELGAKVTVKPMKRDGFFFVSRGIYKFVMHPVESRTGAIRLEDPARGAMWLQLGNKSMLMSQKEGKRLADECASPQQQEFAKNMKPVNLLEAAPAAAAPAAAPSTRTNDNPAPGTPAAAAPPATPAPAQ